MSLSREAAYSKGWAASARSVTFDLDAAETRFLRRHGHEQLDGFLAGWADHASGYPRGHSLSASALVCDPAPMTKPPPIAELIGYAEIGRLLGVSRQRARELAQREDFPTARASGGGRGLLYVQSEVEVWLASWDRQTGRPRKTEETPA